MTVENTSPPIGGRPPVVIMPGPIAPAPTGEEATRSLGEHLPPDTWGRWSTIEIHIAGEGGTTEREKICAWVRECGAWAIHARDGIFALTELASGQRVPIADQFASDAAAWPQLCRSVDRLISLAKQALAGRGQDGATWPAEIAEIYQSVSRSPEYRATLPQRFRLRRVELVDAQAAIDVELTFIDRYLDRHEHG